MGDAEAGGPTPPLPPALSSDAAKLNPFEWYAEMRETAPVRYDPEREAWDVFRYHDVERVLSDFESFGSVSPVPRIGGEADEKADSQNMIGADPPEHDRLRGFVANRFSGRAVREYRPLVERAVEDALAGDAFPAEGEPGEVAFRAAFAVPMPMRVIAGLLGVPRGDRDSLGELLFEDDRAVEYFDRLLDERNRGNETDLLTHVANAGALSRAEQISFCLILLTAGNLTTTNLLTNAIWTFAEEGIVDEIRSGEIDRIQAIEEVLRYRSPIHSAPRVTTTPVEIGGERIPAGERVVAWIGAANHDPAMFDAPDAFRPGRRPNRHIAFGKGTHFCLGAPLARLEADVALERLLTRFETIELVGDRQPDMNPGLYGLAELPCRFG